MLYVRQKRQKAFINHSGELMNRRALIIIVTVSVDQFLVALPESIKKHFLLQSTCSTVLVLLSPSFLRFHLLNPKRTKNLRCFLNCPPCLSTKTETAFASLSVMYKVRQVLSKTNLSKCVQSNVRGTQREYSSKSLKHSIVERILVFKR